MIFRWRSHVWCQGYFINLTNGQECLEFYPAADLMPIVRCLEQSACKCLVTFLTLDLRKFKLASMEIEEFFNFVVRLSRMQPYFTSTAYERCFEDFFADRRRAYRVLAAKERDWARLVERTEVCERLLKEKAIKCQGGFLVDTRDGVYYVAEDGSVRRLNYPTETDLLEAIRRLVRQGTVPKRLADVSDTNELLTVARTIARISPHLALVIAP